MRLSSWLDQHRILTRQAVLGTETRKVIDKRGWESQVTANVSSRRFTETLASTAYTGGLSLAYEHGQTCVGPDEVILDLDFASIFPAAMAVVPVINWAEPPVVVQDLAAVEDAYQHWDAQVVPVMFVECTFAFPPDCLYPCLPVPTKDGLVYPLRGTTVCTGLEVALALEMGA